MGNPDFRSEVKESYTSIELKPEYMHIIGTFLEYHCLMPVSEKERLIREGLLDGKFFAELEGGVVLFDEQKQEYYLNPDCRVNNMNMVIEIPEVIEQ